MMVHLCHGEPVESMHHTRIFSFEFEKIRVREDKYTTKTLCYCFYRLERSTKDRSFSYCVHAMYLRDRFITRSSLCLDSNISIDEHINMFVLPRRENNITFLEISLIFCALCFRNDRVEDAYKRGKITFLTEHFQSMTTSFIGRYIFFIPSNMLFVVRFMRHNYDLGLLFLI